MGNVRKRVDFLLKMWPAIFARIIHYEGIKHIKVLRKAFTEIYRQVKQGTNKELLVSSSTTIAKPEEISVVYFRARYELDIIILMKNMTLVL